nr:NADH:flavin oxidoreductase/NADH oxidase [Acetobacter persici]
MSGPVLFTPIDIQGLTLPNRIVVAPMCQYSAIDGQMTDWHLIHLGSMALSGAGLLTIEATAVMPDGRITYADVGLWDDQTEHAMRRALDVVRATSDVKIAIQLSHAGRKASCEVPWKGGAQIAPNMANGWQAVAPSDLPFQPTDHAPMRLDREGMVRIRDAFVASAHRVARMEIDAVQLHAAHGYLLHQFLSPLSNQRDDSYGGTLENRMRFPLEVFDAVRTVLPHHPVSVRVSGTDWVENGWDIEQTTAFSKALEARGCDAIHVSSGGVSPRQNILVAPGYQVPLARAVKRETSIPVVAVGLITSFEQAEAIVATGDADMIAIARTILYNPRWPWHAAAHLGGHVKAPNQYLRCQPHIHQDLFKVPSS